MPPNGNLEVHEITLSYFYTIVVSYFKVLDEQRQKYLELIIFVTKNYQPYTNSFSPMSLVCHIQKILKISFSHNTCACKTPKTHLSVCNITISTNAVCFPIFYKSVIIFFDDFCSELEKFFELRRGIVMINQ